MPPWPAERPALVRSAEDWSAGISAVTEPASRRSIGGRSGFCRSTAQPMMAPRTGSYSTTPKVSGPPSRGLRSCSKLQLGRIVDAGQLRGDLCRKLIGGAQGLPGPPVLQPQFRLGRKAGQGCAKEADHKLSRRDRTQAVAQERLEFRPLGKRSLAIARGRKAADIFLSRKASRPFQTSASSR